MYKEIQLIIVYTILHIYLHIVTDARLILLSVLYNLL